MTGGELAKKYTKSERCFYFFTHNYDIFYINDSTFMDERETVIKV